MSSNSDFHTRLTQIHQIKVVQSPPSSSKKPQKLINDEMPLNFEDYPKIPLQFNTLDGPSPELRKVYSENYSHIQQNELVLTKNLSSKIDLLFNKIERIKCEFQVSNNDLKQRQDQFENKQNDKKGHKKQRESYKNSNKKNSNSKKENNTLQNRALIQLPNNHVGLERNGESIPLGENIQIRDFVLGKCIGSGKYGDVYVSIHKRTGLIFALKKILKTTVREYNMISQLTTELKIHSYLQHPNIVKLYTFFDDEFHIFLVMQYGSQGGLIDHLNKKQEFSSQVVSQVIDGISYLHDKKVMHRDLKPQNIIMFPNNIAKIADFGWASQIFETPSSTFCGTLDYVSPQMKDKGFYQESVDVWSLGILTFELLAGFAPYKNEISHWKLCGSKRQDQWKWQVIFPPSISTISKSFIEGILKEEPQLRSTLSECKTKPFINFYENYSTNRTFTDDQLDIFQ